jgi:2-dehydropantoate 2-reductase
MKLLLIGAGSVGAYFCGRAAQGGAAVEVVVHSGFETIQKNGYSIASIAGDFTFRPERLLHHSSEASADIDAVILATKVLPEVDRKALLEPVLNRETHPPVLLIQNGVGIEDEIAEAFPDNEIISGIAYIGASRPAPGKILHSGAGRLIIGKFGGGDSAAADMLAAVFRTGGVPCETVENIALERWRKLLWNLPFNPVSVLGGGLNSRQLCDGGETEALCAALMKEVIAVANAAGVPLTGEMAAEQFEYTRHFPPYKTSMLQDFEAGRALEVDAIIGNAVKIADRLDVPVPVMRTCAALLRTVDREKRRK